MRKFKLFFACLLMAVLSIGQMWAADAAVDDVLWSENFAHFGTRTPSNAGTGTGTSTWESATVSYTQSSTATKGYNETLAGGTAPELLLSKSNQTWTISGIPTGNATKMALSFLSNKTTFAVTTTTSNLTITGSGKAWTISVNNGKPTPATFNLTIKNTGSQNARLDNVQLVVVTAAGAPSACATPTFSVATGVYTSVQNVTISCETEGATVYYTTDGNAPTTASAVYSAAISVSEKTTIKAMAVKEGNTNSEIATASYAITTHDGTENDPYNVSEARDVIDVLGTKSGVYVSGIVSAIAEAYNATYHNISFDLSDDGTTSTPQFRAYRCKGLNNTNFASEDDVKLGATATVYGNLVKYGSTYELGSGCYLTAYEAPIVQKIDISNTKATAYTVSEALALTLPEANSDLSKKVYIKGVVYDVKSFNYTNGTYNIYIREEGKTENDGKFEFFKCEGLYDTDLDAVVPFAEGDVQIGNEVIGYGMMTYYGDADIWEFSAGNYLEDLQAPVTGVEISEATAVISIGENIDLNSRVSVLPSNAIQTLEWSVQSGSEYASVDNGIVSGLAVGEAVIRATAQGTEFFAECTVTVNDIPKYTISFDGNGADGGNAPEAIADKAESAVVTLPVNAYTYTGHMFTGWKVFNDLTSEEIEVNNGTFEMPAASVTLQAQWMVASMVTFVAGTDQSDGTSITKDGITISATTFSNASYYQCYQGHSMTIAAESGVGTIIRIEITCTVEGSAKYGPGQWSIEGYSVNGNVGTWDGSSTSIVFANAALQARMTQIVVYYLPDTREASGLVWNPADDIELTVGDAFTAPALLNPNNIDAAEITIESSNIDLAQVTAGVVSLVENATGEAKITATFAGNDTYKPATVSYNITVNAATPVVITDYYEKVTSTDNITYGTYLIVYETGSLAFDGNHMKLNTQTSENELTLDDSENTMAITFFEEGKIEATSERNAAAFIIDPELGTLQSVSGKFIGVSSNNNGLKDNGKIYTYRHSFEIDDDKNAVIKALFENSTMTMRYNSASNQLRFRYFKNGQQAVQLYKRVNEAPKADPELAYETQAYNLFVGDDFTAPVLGKATSFEGTVTYESSKTGTAAVIAETGEVTLNNAGTATIYAVFAGNSDYKADYAYYTITLTQPELLSIAISEDVNTKTYTDGDELNPAGLVVTGTYSNNEEKAITNGITWTFNPEFLSVGTTSVMVKATVGTIESAEYEVSGLTVNAQTYGSYNRTGLTIDYFGTICLPQAGTIEGATLFEIGAYENGKIYCDEVEGGVMEAGKPYIFQATSDQLNVYYTSAAIEATAGVANGLHGFYNLESENAILPLADDASLGNYILYQNQYWLVSGRAATIANFRAYIRISEINYVAPAPGRRRVAMNVNGEQTATGINELNAAEAPVKMIMNGQLYILRGEKLYNANGQIVK